MVQPLAFGSIDAHNVTAGINATDHATVNINYTGRGDTHGSLPCASSAAFNSWENQSEAVCLPGTRVDLLRDIHVWLRGQDQSLIFWLNGLAGTGKTTICRTVAQQCLNEGLLAATFFFDRGEADLSHAGKFVTTIAMQLASSIPALRSAIEGVARARQSIASQSLKEQWMQLVLGPLSRLDGEGVYALVIDALDACCDDQHIEIILGFLGEIGTLKNVRLRVLLASRPEVAIRFGFSQMQRERYRDFVLHTISTTVVENDIKLFLEHEFKLIQKENMLDASWPGAAKSQHLASAASGLFIWAATASRFVRRGRRFAMRRLDTLLEGTRRDGAAGTPEERLDTIYMTVLGNSIHEDYSKSEVDEACLMSRQVLGSIVVLLTTMSAESLSKIIAIPLRDFEQTVQELHSILNIPEDKAQPIRLHHPSFRDFLLSKERCRDERFFVDEISANRILTENCINLMSSTLKQDICGFDSPGKIAAEVDGCLVDHFLPPELQYACRFWTQHLEKSHFRLHENNHVYNFLQTHLLHWLEALGWMNKVAEAVHASMVLMSVFGAETEGSHLPQQLDFIRDVHRFILYNRALLEQAPLQIYSSGLAFAPQQSVVRRHFQGLMPRWIETSTMTQKKWGFLLKTLEIENEGILDACFSLDATILVIIRKRGLRVVEVESGSELFRTNDPTPDPIFCFSSDGKLLAVSENRMNVKIFSTESGLELQTLVGHRGRILAIAFSPDAKYVITTSEDCTARLWDVDCGNELHAVFCRPYPYDSVLCPMRTESSASLTNILFESSKPTSGIGSERSAKFNSASFSPNGEKMALGTHDGTIMVLDTTSKKLLKVIQTRSPLSHFTFSPDGNTILSIHDDKLAFWWDIQSGNTLKLLKSSFYFRSKFRNFFSSDFRFLVWPWPIIKIYDANSAEELHSFKYNGHRISQVVFSPDNKTLAGVADFNKIGLWDTSSWTMVKRLDVTPTSVVSLAFTPSSKTLVTLSDNGTMKLWDAEWTTEKELLEDDPGLIHTLKISPNKTMLVSISSNQCVTIWNAATAEHLHTLPTHERFCYNLYFSPNGKMLASSHPEAIIIWNPQTGMQLHTLGCDYSNGHICFSPDNVLILVTLSLSQGVAVWDLEKGTRLGDLDNAHRLPAFSPDGKKLALVSNRKYGKRWGGLWRSYNTLILDSDKTVPTSDYDGSIMLKSEHDLRLLWNFTGIVTRLAFAQDNKTLVWMACKSSLSGLYDNFQNSGCEIRVGNAHSRQLINTLQLANTPHILELSADGSLLAMTGVSDGVVCSHVQIWEIMTGTMLHKLEFDVPHTALSFLSNGPWLQTNRGLLKDIPAASFPIADNPQTTRIPSLFFGKHWITGNGEKMIWVPPSYRSNSCVIVYNDIIVLPDNIGGIGMIKFKH